MPTAVSAISSFPLFDGIAFGDLEALLAASRTIHARKNAQVFAQGAEAQSFFVLLDGYVRATKSTEDGNEITVRYVSPGEIFGVAAAIGLDRYPATATAVVDATYPGRRRSGQPSPVSTPHLQRMPYVPWGAAFRTPTIG